MVSMETNLKIKIQKYLRQKRLKPYQLGNLCGVAPASIYRFLKGERSLMMDTAIKIDKFIDRTSGE